MLIALTRGKLEQVVPFLATGRQYRFYWGEPADLIRRALISFLALVIVLVLGNSFGTGENAIAIILAIIGGFYWLWVPIYLATLRNGEYRRYPYGGFWRGRVLDVYITEEPIKKIESVSRSGELVIVEDIERRLNLDVGDETDFRLRFQTPLRPIHKGIKRGTAVEAIVLSKRPDLSRISKVTDAYLPQRQLWIGMYPCLRRDVFLQVSEELQAYEPRGDRASQRQK